MDALVRINYARPTPPDVFRPLLVVPEVLSTLVSFHGKCNKVCMFQVKFAIDPSWLFAPPPTTIRYWGWFSCGAQLCETGLSVRGFLRLPGHQSRQLLAAVVDVFFLHVRFVFDDQFYRAIEIALIKHIQELLLHCNNSVFLQRICHRPFCTSFLPKIFCSWTSEISTRGVSLADLSLTHAGMKLSQRCVNWKIQWPSESTFLVKNFQRKLVVRSRQSDAKTWSMWCTLCGQASTECALKCFASPSQCGGAFPVPT